MFEITYDLLIGISSGVISYILMNAKNIPMHINMTIDKNTTDEQLTRFENILNRLEELKGQPSTLQRFWVWCRQNYQAIIIGTLVLPDAGQQNDKVVRHRQNQTTNKQL